MPDISPITDYLYLASRMDFSHIEDLQVLKIDLIISMIGNDRPPDVFGKPPMRLVWLRAYDTFLTPVSMRMLRKGVREARPVIDRGGRVLVFCRAGRHRSVTMAAAILISQGYTADEAAGRISDTRAVADPAIWYVKRRIRKFERYWKKRREQAEPAEV
jgi:protein-tyrosine phosphatase